MERHADLLLGRTTPVVNTYTPELLFPIERSNARRELGYAQKTPFYGVDVWHAYEVSWLDSTGKPQCAVARFEIPAHSPNLVESKSFKLYLNSLNSHKFTSEEDAINCIVEDISAVAGSPVKLTLFEVDDPRLTGAILSGNCLDSLGVTIGDMPPTSELLEAGEQVVEEMLYSHLLRSLCPVTGQPDWATVWIHYKGRAITRDSVLRYIISYRQHQEFHEQCVERIFRDILHSCAPEFLHVQAFYTRRGGLDISPFRSTSSQALPQARLNRQ